MAQGITHLMTDDCKAAHEGYAAGCVCCAPTPAQLSGRTQESAPLWMDNTPPTPGRMVSAQQRLTGSLREANIAANLTAEVDAL